MTEPPVILFGAVEMPVSLRLHRLRVLLPRRRVDDLPQLYEDIVVSAGDAPVVFEPEVEEIAVDDQRRRLSGREIEPGAEGAPVIGRSGSEVDVGDEQNGLVSCGHARR